MVPFNYKDMKALTLKELLVYAVYEEAADRLLKAYKSPQEIYDAPLNEIAGVMGSDQMKAYQFKASMEVGRRFYLFPRKEKPIISSPGDAALYLYPLFTYKDREQFICLALNTKNRLIDHEVVSVGSLSSTTVHPREVFKFAIKHSAQRIILTHNHPSGDPTPSDEDIILTKRMANAGNVLGIEVCDHIVIGDIGKFVSLKNKGLF